MKEMPEICDYGGFPSIFEFVILMPRFWELDVRQLMTRSWLFKVACCLNWMQ